MGEEAGEEGEWQWGSEEDVDEGCEPHSGEQTSAGLRSFACPHASFIGVASPRRETLHLFCKC